MQALKIREHVEYLKEDLSLFYKHSAQLIKINSGGFRKYANVIASNGYSIVAPCICPHFLRHPIHLHLVHAPAIVLNIIVTVAQN